MVFSSMYFLFFFLPVLLLIYYVVPYQFKNLILFLGSLFFYAWGEPVYIILMIFSILINFVSGLEIERYKKLRMKHNARLACRITIIVNLLILGFYKYYGFVLDNVNHLFHLNIGYKQLALPIGISFYTFQALSYVIDVQRGKVKAQHNFIHFATYITMFPQLIAGPIIRYADISKQIRKRRVNLSKIGEGAIWFIQGLAKKVILANNIGNIYHSIQATSHRPVLTAWIGAFAFTMQIYFDFSGYSDMAIGLGKMLGFDFMKNFDYPYTAESITEFWRKWHISLGNWFREYVYIPLGGNRVNVIKHIRNLLIVWALTGLWHGAAWNFVVWGLYYGLLLILEKYLLKGILSSLPKFVRHIYTMFLVVMGWVLFSADSLSQALSYMGQMFGIGASGFVNWTTWYYFRSTLILGILCVISCGPWFFQRLTEWMETRDTGKRNCVIAYYVVIFLISVAYLVNATYNPFLYFRF